MLPEFVLRDIRQYNNLEPNDTSKDDVFNVYNLRNVLDEYMGWNDIRGYTSDLVAIAKHFGAKG